MRVLMRALPGALLLLSAVVLAVLTWASSAGTGVSVVSDSDAARISGAQSYMGCGISNSGTTANFCTRNVASGLCPPPTGGACGTGQCPYDCTVARPIYNAGLLLQAVVNPPPVCAPPGQANCTPGLIWGCNCSGTKAPQPPCGNDQATAASNCAAGGGGGGGT